ncbi:MAG: hypothetical protein FRX48_07772 [Lasallia pustulata]|uniref:Uncharacterized protein n=1 Tax=Lasallia pustulata TaxID=136370 RepID=A0A5M8PIE7_9LECA|nr:MAG: hypothetical protein FRX48_07772 [Lasallia pustulata]
MLILAITTATDNATLFEAHSLTKIMDDFLTTIEAYHSVLSGLSAESSTSRYQDLALRKRLASHLQSITPLIAVAAFKAANDPDDALYDRYHARNKTLVEDIDNLVVYKQISKGAGGSEDKPTELINPRDFAPILFFTELPLTCSHVERAVGLYHKLTHNLHLASPMNYDFFPSAGKFVIRMLTPIHKLLLTQVVREITRQLQTIALGDSPSPRFAQDIEYGASATIDSSKAGYGRHDPDGQFQHFDTNLPGVVVEVAYSQKKRDLWRLADDYILGLDGSIPLVVGLNIEYRAKHATLSIWRPRVWITDAGMEELSVEQTVIDHVICDEDGTPNPDQCSENPRPPTPKGSVYHSLLD